MRLPCSSVSRLRGCALAACALALALLLPAVGLSAPPGEAAARSQAVGVGDGRIHVISTIEPYSIKNGETLTVSAIISASRPVASVEANLGGLATVTLEPDAARGGLSADGTTGVWSAEWTGQGLEERVYAATLTVTDGTGHAFTDHTLVFSDPAAGISDPGTTNYPNGAMRRMDAEAFVSELDLQAAVIDPENGYAYFGLGTTPGRVVKVALGGGGDPPHRVGAVTFEPGEDDITCAVIDPESGYAYFGTGTLPAYVVKVALGEGEAPPRRVAATPLEKWTFIPHPHPGTWFPLPLGPAGSAVMDPAAGYAYFGMDADPGVVVKIALGEGDAPPVVTNLRTLEEEESYLRTAVIDTEKGYAYFGTHTLPGYVVKVALGEGDEAPERMGAAALQYTINVPDLGIIRIPDGHPSSAVIDPAGGHAYFGTETPTGFVVKVALGEGDNPPVRRNRATLSEGEGYLRSAVIDAANGYAYFGVGGPPDQIEAGEQRIVKVALGEGNAAPSRAAVLELEAGAEAYLHSAVIDPENGYAYFGTHTGPYLPFWAGRVVKVALGDEADAPERLGHATLHSSASLFTGHEAQIGSAVINPASGHAYFGSLSLPGRVVKVGIGGPEKTPIRLGACSLPWEGLWDTSYGELRSAVADPQTGYAWFGSGTEPGGVVKVAMGEGDALPTHIATLELPAGVNDLRSAVIDTENGYAYFGTNTAPGKVVKVALGYGVSPPTHVATLTLDEGEDYLTSAVIDMENGHAYFGTNTDPGRVVKVALGSGDAPPVRLGAAVLELFIHIPPYPPLEMWESYLTSAVIDTANGFAYFGTDTSPAHVAMVALGAGNAAPSRVGSITLATGEDNLRSAVLDPATRHAYFGTGTTPGRVVKVELGEGGQLPMRLGAIELAEGEGGLSAAVMDPAKGYAYFATAGATNTLGRVIRVALGHKGFLHGMRIDVPEDAAVNELRFHTHAPGGNFRLAIYDDDEPGQLRWQSPSLAAHPEEGEVSVAVSGGTPTSLVLPAGTYWAVWQVDTNVPTASYTQGTAGDGFVMPFAYGDPPATLCRWGTETTADLWTISLIYDPAEIIPGDFNGDGCVNFQDFIILLENWGQEYQGTMMNFAAFIALLENWGTGC